MDVHISIFIVLFLYEAIAMAERIIILFLHDTMSNIHPPNSPLYFVFTAEEMLAVFRKNWHSLWS
jgi:hypothetical protein